ncbi:MAG: hypothetical protein J4215_02845 [Candidatus Diapherotrites archaeon]|uniref:Uncharacterized protein n=1 Tax=Candidatus Iainarchaeum sp. TaxID=3101447 RepID=A0A8T4L4Q4_9ARCH|nr:hypothetical protein [Candidatus Diapherotrites archaeon]
MPRPRKPIAKPLPKIAKPLPTIDPTHIFVTTSVAARKLKDYGVKITEGQLGKWIDNGLYTGARIVHHPRKARIIEENVVDQMIANAAAGQKLYAGLKAPKKGFGAPSVDQRKEISRRIAANKRKSAADWRQFGGNIEKNLDTIAPLRRELFLRDDVDYQKLLVLDRKIKEGLKLPPKEFNQKIVLVIRRVLAKKTKP